MQHNIRFNFYLPKVRKNWNMTAVKIQKTQKILSLQTI